jgi:hypothetical protein
VAGKEVAKPVPAEVAKMPTAEEMAIAAQAMGNIGTEGLVIPRLKLTQGLTKEVSDGDAMPGHYINSVSMEDYGTELYVSMLVPQHIRLLIPVGQGLQCRSIENKPNPMMGVGTPGGLCAKCSYAQWVGKEPPMCNEAYQYYILVVDDKGELLDPMPMAITFMKTSFKEAKKWNTMMMMVAKNLLPWQLVYKLSFDKINNDKGNYFSPKVNTLKGVQSSAEVQELAWTMVPRLIEQAATIVVRDDSEVDYTVDEEDVIPY